MKYLALGLLAAIGTVLAFVFRSRSNKPVNQLEVPSLFLSPSPLSYHSAGPARDPGIDLAAGHALVSPESEVALDTSGKPRGVRNNNPLNVKDNGDPWQGKIGVDKDGFLQFATVQDGVRCGTIVLARYFNQGLTTLQAIISKFAPSTDKNDVPAYVRFVGTLLNVGATQQLNFSTYGLKLVNAMGHYEQGKPLTTWWPVDQLALGYQAGAERVAIV